MKPPIGVDAVDPLWAAFVAGYDAAWKESGEGHNGEYASTRFTAEKYEAARERAYARFRDPTHRDPRD